MFGWSYPAGCTSTPYDYDFPETCPCCGGANADEDAGVELYKADPAFCSKACADTYATQQSVADERYAAALVEEDRIVQAWLDQEATDAATALAAYRAQVSA